MLGKGLFVARLWVAEGVKGLVGGGAPHWVIVKSAENNVDLAYTGKCDSKEC